ncbi:protein HIRA/HIR1 [Nematocida displodere]|uniref:Protein HIRA/HIR1 n=1 Tax=Nematocida displodere TaxID=1805483 RepID=A0A177EE65_9MICR|nr:protein HIRA/HIR1 [Nematocida displodere]
MKVVLTSTGHFLNKKKCTVFSVDFWPKNKLFVVSGGQDGVIHIWKIETKESIEVGKVSKHAGAVLCVRFTDEGDLLASASDGGQVIIWGVEEKEGVLHIYHKKKMADHRSDVSSVSWSPKYLATGGYDGSVIVYDRKTLTVIKRLERHEKGCKGLSFSPGGVFLSTYGDEGELFLYSKDLVKVASTKKPFRGVHTESFFGRMSWSPDGRYIGCGLAFVDRRDAVSVLSSSLIRDYTLVGHVAPAEVVAFNPRVWKKKETMGYIVATGSQDRSIAIWSSGASKPLILLKEVAEQPIMDMRWSSDGISLIACAYDGSILEIVFSPNELGVGSVPEIDQGQNLAYSKEFIHLPVEETELPGAEGASTQEPVAISTASTAPKPKIVPRLIAPLALSDSKEYARGPRVVLYVPRPETDAGLPEEKCPAVLEVVHNSSMYRITVSRSISLLTITKGGAEWFTSTGLKTKTFAASGAILVVVSETYTGGSKSFESVWVYNIEKCVQVLPVMPFAKVVAVDTQEEKVLIILPGKFKVLDLSGSASIEDVLVNGPAVVNVSLDRRYFLLALYADGTTQYYDPKIRTWFILELNGPSVFSDTFTEIEDSGDSTLEFLENRFLVSMSHENWPAVEDSLLKIVAASANALECSPGLVNRVDGIIEAFLHRAGAGGAEFVRMALWKAGDSESLQKFVHYKIKDLERRYRPYQ